MTKQHIYPFENVACAFAALSPRITYRMNCLALVELMRDGVTNLGYKANVFKAKRILMADNPLSLVGTKHPSKSIEFAKNILGDTNAVTLDTWMFYILRFDGWITPRRYERLAAKITRAANKVGESPRDFQAILWIHTRGGDV
jgi:hypothetical protein